MYDLEADRFVPVCVYAHYITFSDVQGLKRKLSSKLSIVDESEGDAEDEDDWQVTLVQARESLQCIVQFLANLQVISRNKVGTG